MSLAQVRAQMVERMTRSYASKAVTPVDVVGNKSVWTCLRHADGKRPKLAEAYALTGGAALFIAKIRPLASDQLTLRPWEREHYLGAGASLDLLTDDELLAGWLDHLDKWGQGLPADGPRWLRKAPDFTLRTVVERTDDEAGVVGCWMRCADHAKPKMITTSELFRELDRRAR